tara:strand:+ start:5129 stop:5539 length:411 start_codon:yes stop_codon:yes gene_type:complete
MTKTLLLLEWERYTEIFNIKPNRDRFNIVCRFAFMVSARRAFTTKQIGSVMGKDHSTVVHAAKQHEMNIKFDKDYQRMFDVCEDIMSSIITSDDYQAQTNRIDTVLENIRLRSLVNNKSQKILQLEDKLHRYELCD